MNSHHDFVLGEAVDLRPIRIENLGPGLHLKIVIAGAERTHLAALALASTFRDTPRDGATHLAALFDPIKVEGITPAAIDSPVRATGQHCVHLDSIEGNGAGAADACR